jgi:hypothetical protein
MEIQIKIPKLRKFHLLCRKMLGFYFNLSSVSKLSGFKLDHSLNYPMTLHILHEL